MKLVRQRIVKLDILHRVYHFMDQSLSCESMGDKTVAISIFIYVFWEV